MWVEEISDVIQKYEVSTQDTFYASNSEDFTGWRINVSQPVAVISGHVYAHFAGTYQHVYDSLPSGAAAGTQ